MSEAVKSLFTDISPTYDRLNHLLSLNLDKIWRRKAISLINDYLTLRLSDSQKVTQSESQKVSFLALDLCCGTFDLSLECLRQFPNAQIIAADFSHGMLNAGREKISQSINSGKIIPICGDGLKLPLADNSLNVIFCGYGVRNFDSTKIGLQEMNRVLKAGGQIIVLEFFKPSSWVSNVFHKSYAKFLIPLLGKIISGHESAYHYLRDSIQGFLTIQEFKNLLEECNYKDIKINDFFMSVSTAVSAIKN